MSQSTLTAKQDKLIAAIAECDKALANLYSRYFGAAKPSLTSEDWADHDAAEAKIEAMRWELNNKLFASKCSRG
jgi:hypothetical protein